ncbi:endonuclease [Mariniflexile gromovii]|uniref:Endonuclease n=1 Tax=Mariniflexile gromovii TaxID=362523 RepID=A0ABS4BRX7_9FLAO|nr:endonuclease [Mariniflexile gromovii]MBP0903330.1 endonuclease [Mariniflexile gromovii]
MKQLYFLFFTSIAFAQLTPPANLQSYYSGIDFNKTGTNLFDDLAVTTASKHTNYISYSDVWEADKITDEDPANSNNVLLIYGYNDNDGNYITDRSRSKTLNGGTQGTDWNREHTFPNSLASPKLEDSGTNVPPYADAHNLRPSDVRMNNNRGNLLFASGSGNAGNVSGNWYPGDEWKGDVARIIMYMYLRYGTQCKPSYTAVGTTNSVDSNMINLLLQWNAEDQVSTIEDNRNTYHGNASNTYGQGNRNPFIDNPYLATVIWGGTVAQNRWNSLSTNNREAINFSIYPNPTKENVFKITLSNHTTNLNLEIFNVLGKSVLKQKLSNNTSEINIGTLKKGIYLVRLNSDKGSITKKLIKQ